MADNKSAYGEMDKFYSQAVASLVAAAGVHDDLATEHSERVKLCALTIAGQIDGIAPEEMKDIGYAASLHDIGKIAVSCKILNKLGRLTEEEFQIMREHSVIAARILEKIDGLHGAIPMIRHHHERYDGDGYPDGLAGEDIPLGARIVSVAEAYDILTTDVPWRKAMSKKDALKEIEHCSGTQFDPRIVSVLHSAVAEPAT